MPRKEHGMMQGLKYRTSTDMQEIMIILRCEFSASIDSKYDSGVDYRGPGRALLSLPPSTCHRKRSIQRTPVHPQISNSVVILYKKYAATTTIFCQSDIARNIQLKFATMQLEMLWA